MSVTSAGSGNWDSTTPNAPWTDGIVPDGSTNVIIANGHTVTVSSSTTFANDVTINSGGILSIQNDFTVGADSGSNNAINNSGILDVPYNIAGDYTLTLKGNYLGNSGSEWKIASSANRLDSARKFTIKVNCSASLANDKYNINISAGGKLKWYGASKTTHTTLTAMAQANATNKTMSLTDVTGWKSGDRLCIADGKNFRWTLDDTISSIDGNNVTMTNLLGTQVTGVTGSPSADTFYVGTDHYLLTGDIVVFTALDTITGVDINTPYYAIITHDFTFKVATTEENARAGIAINITGVQSSNCAYYTKTKRIDTALVMNMSHNIIATSYDSTYRGRINISNQTSKLSVLSNVEFNNLGGASEGVNFGIMALDNSNNDNNFAFYNCWTPRFRSDFDAQDINVYKHRNSYILQSSGNTYRASINTLNLVGGGFTIDGNDNAYFWKVNNFITMDVMGSATNWWQYYCYFKNYTFKGIRNYCIDWFGGSNYVETLTGYYCDRVINAMGGIRIKNFICKGCTADNYGGAYLEIENYTPFGSMGGNAKITNYNNVVGYNRWYNFGSILSSDSTVYRTSGKSLNLYSNQATNPIAFVISSGARTAYVNTGKAITLACHVLKDVASTGASAILRIARGTDGHGLDEVTEYSVYPTGVQSTVTMTQANPCVLTLNSHGFNNGDKVSLFTTGALYTGLTAGKGYFVVNKDTNTFQLSETEGGTAIATTGSQSGTHKVAKWESKSFDLGDTTSSGFISVELITYKGDTAWNLWIDDLTITESTP